MCTMRTIAVHAEEGHEAEIIWPRMGAHGNCLVAKHLEHQVAGDLYRDGRQNGE
jgi:hypothetical protein